MMRTAIYVKKLPNGLFYLGKTERDPFKYKGSGVIWTRTIKKYGYKLQDIETWILHETEDKQDLINMGRYYSKLFDVVKSEKWANLKDEEGSGFGSKENNPWYKKPGFWAGKKQPQEMINKRVASNTGQKRPKQSQSMVGRFSGNLSWHFGKPSRHAKKILKFDLEDNFLCEYPNSYEAAKSVNGVATKVIACCKGRRRIHMKHKWKYKNDKN